MEPEAFMNAGAQCQERPCASDPRLLGQGERARIANATYHPALEIGHCRQASHRVWRLCWLALRLHALRCPFTRRACWSSNANAGYLRGSDPGCSGFRRNLDRPGSKPDTDGPIYPTSDPYADTCSAYADCHPPSTYTYAHTSPTYTNADPCCRNRPRGRDS